MLWKQKNQKMSIKSIIECGVMNNVFGYVTAEDINSILIAINLKLYNLHWAELGHVQAINYTIESIKHFTDLRGYDWSHINLNQQFHMYKIHLLMQKNQLLADNTRIAQMALENNPFRRG